MEAGNQCLYIIYGSTQTLFVFFANIFPDTLLP